MIITHPEVSEKCVDIRLLALDSDGVLTDGGVYITNDGDEFRRFDIKDGAGLKAIMAFGIEVAVISSGNSCAIRHRCHQLGIREIHIEVKDKIACLQEVCERHYFGLENVCYMGDDSVDLPVLSVVGVSCTPADACEEVKARVDIVTLKPGGRGAVRELCEWIITTQAEKR